MWKSDARILVIDDMTTMRKVVIKSLKEFGFTDFQEASDGNLGWEVLNQSSPPIQLIISDWNMPNCSGLDLLKKIRSDAKFRNLPFILLTAESESHQVMEAVRSGVSNYIVKPFTPPQLKEKIDQTYKKIYGGKA